MKYSWTNLLKKQSSQLDAFIAQAEAQSTYGDSGDSDARPVTLGIDTLRELVYDSCRGEPEDILESVGLTKQSDEVAGMSLRDSNDRLDMLGPILPAFMLMSGVLLDALQYFQLSEIMDELSELPDDTRELLLKGFHDAQYSQSKEMVGFTVSLLSQLIQLGLIEITGSSTVVRAPK